MMYSTFGNSGNMHNSFIVHWLFDGIALYSIFQVMTSVKKYVEMSMQSFYIMLPAIMYVLQLEKHKMQIIKNHNIVTEK